jgi:hypothetical protein
MYFLLECFIFFSWIKLLLWFNILLHPLVLRWVLSYYFNSCLSSSSHDYIDVSSIIPHFCINPLYILVVLVPLFLDIFQECSRVFYIMVCCTKVHTCRWWKWTFPCIMFYFLAIVTHYWAYASSKSSSTTSYTSVSTLIPSWCVVLRYLVIPRRVILWLCIIVLWLCSVILLLCIVVWRWYLVGPRCIFPCHNFFFHLIII